MAMMLAKVLAKMKRIPSRNSYRSLRAEVAIFLIKRKIKECNLQNNNNKSMVLLLRIATLISWCSSSKQKIA